MSKFYSFLKEALKFFGDRLGFTNFTIEFKQMVGLPSGQALVCKASNGGSNPPPTSIQGHFTDDYEPPDAPVIYHTVNPPGDRKTESGIHSLSLNGWLRS
jgi:hypothetical protein